MDQKLKEKIAAAPNATGVYIFKDAGGRILYVGKALSLKKRLGSYLRPDVSAKTWALMENVADVELRFCANESMALLLEQGLIHEHKPKYNVALRDDKSFPYVKITAEEFPAVCITRKRDDRKARYIGPFTNVKLLREALKTIRRSFPYRSCIRLPKEECIYYRLGLSPAPCTGKIDKKEYARTIESIILILEGKTDSLIRKLELAMQEKSGERDFEEAARIRDRIASLASLGTTRGYGSGPDQVRCLQEYLKLSRPPERIEAFDISNISGTLACGSMVSFYQGFPDKNNYRRFRIKTVGAIDDYAMIREVVRRRYSRLKEEKKPFPDLVLIDGGRGHLLSAGEEIARLGLRMPLISIAKDRENIYVSGREYPLRFSGDTPALNLIRRIRDEAHRFAVTYHRLLRKKKMLGSG